MDIRVDIKQFLENNSYNNVVVDRFRAFLKNTSAGQEQIIISDMPSDQPNGYFVKTKIAIGVKRSDEGNAKDVCEQIEYLFSNKGGKIITGGIEFDRITVASPTIFVGFNQTENTAIYECQLNFTYIDTNYINNYL